ncbi:hypothetical protein A6302_00434 [Methylobrevis pamukkalensis]|uniref:Uncharacterized protein n=1 Tax=Methylobrevis pamukkalensis TaxID=1439726 RepID=A0A1E3H7W3_9HYPH|nr:hypothetical protein A6302_00434 [Methylobrevis pamukkalensis]
MRGIEVRLAVLDADPALAPVIEDLRAALRAFDFDRYMATLDTAGAEASRDG